MASTGTRVSMYPWYLGSLVHQQGMQSEVWELLKITAVCGKTLSQNQQTAESLSLTYDLRWNFFLCLAGHN